MLRFKSGSNRKTKNSSPLSRIDGSFESLDLRSSDYDSIFDAPPVLYPPGANFSGSCLADRVFVDKDLSHASFKEADLTRVKFYRCKLDFADFTDALITDAEFVRCTLRSLHGIEHAVGIAGFRSCHYGGWPLDQFCRTGVIGGRTSPGSPSSSRNRPHWLGLIIGRLLLISGLPWWARTQDGRRIIDIMNDASELDSLLGAMMAFVLIAISGVLAFICLSSGAVGLGMFFLWPVGGFCIFACTCIGYLVFESIRWILGLSD